MMATRYIALLDLRRVHYLVVAGHVATWVVIVRLLRIIVL